MIRQFVFAALSGLCLTACGGAMDEQAELSAQKAAVLSSTDPLVGKWCHATWPGCFTINTSGSAFMSNNGDGCWLEGDEVFSGLAPGSTPGTYTGTRIHRGRGVCASPPPYPLPTSTTITMTGSNSFSEVSGSFTASWVRSP
ncbi:hypothetical protein D7X55_21540 [Corallococcus sp. AB049A]|uniref:Lipoprotein n=1 Tax=Corallococcus interemptor TaxID=2316720 RepID=A0A3A8QWC6_9BACT|nr:hypothetical protein D7Y23_01460 [Corallococcus sp. AB050B]RKH67434.1 hypothetical protein D7X96_19565 [Corallococcus interemptor]RKI62952.1 hypothetical protein D7X55_21540 [Corallococcus sp. AB049A]